MKINKALIKEKFNEYNKLYFNSELPKCEIKIKSAYRYYGLFECKYHEKYKKATFKTITISDLYDYTDENLKNILVHEMIHYFLIEKKKSGEAQIERLICMWHDGCIDLPSYDWCSSSRSPWKCR